MRGTPLGRSEHRETLLHTSADGRQTAYELIRSARRRRTIAISVLDGRVIVRAPLHAATAEVEAFVARRATWIASALASPNPTRTGLRQGQPLPFAGGEFTVAWERSELHRHTLVLRDGALTIRLAVGVPIGDEPGVVAAQLLRWYSDRACELLDEAVKRWAPSIGVTPTAIYVRNQRSRWGSCARNGALRFNLRLAMVSNELLDYVVVHELAHLLHANHSPAFWAEVSRAMPDYDKRRAELKRFSSPL